MHHLVTWVTSHNPPASNTASHTHTHKHTHFLTNTHHTVYSLSTVACCMYSHTSNHIHTLTHTHTHTHTHSFIITHTHTHTHTHTLRNLAVADCGRRGRTCPTCAQFLNNTLTESQAEKCYQDSAPIEAIAKGSRDAIVECQVQNKHNKWNCSTFFGQDLFGKFVVAGQQVERFTLRLLTNCFGC